MGSVAKPKLLEPQCKAVKSRGVLVYKRAYTLYSGPICLCTCARIFTQTEAQPQKARSIRQT